MRHHRQMQPCLGQLIWLAGLFLICQGPILHAAEERISFKREILPLLSDNCFQCHGPDEEARKAKLRLDTPEGAFRVKDGLAVIAPGSSQNSELYKRITSRDPDEVMPPPDSNHSLTARQIETVKRWIDQGAPWSEHWAFEKLSRPEPPSLRKWRERIENPIDQFVFARLEKEGLKPSPPASKLTWLRRVTLDLTGLPPTPEEVDAFLADRSAGAKKRVIDRLLASKAYGERMAWDWMEVARYADSNGYQGDSDRTMWPWRDWVVEAFSSNLPYDQFTVWQLAGDLLPENAREQKLATAFLRNHPINGEGGRIPEENRVDYVMDMAETTGTAWLGLTFNCCRCHDHKYDPLTRRDYYSFFAYFNQTPVDGSGGDPQTKPVLELISEMEKERLARLGEEIRLGTAEIEQFELSFFPRPEGKTAAESEKVKESAEGIKNILKKTPDKRSRGDWAELEKEFEKAVPDYHKLAKQVREKLEARDAVTRGITRVMVMEEMAKPRQTHLLEKGLYDKRGDAISAALPVKLFTGQPPTNRLGLARWIVSPDNPLTARVTVNRLWQQFFGAGLVKTSENFGVQGEPPAHPELLDWLASEFIASGWDVKELCRLMVSSATYGQSSRVSPEIIEKDPENRLLARGPRFRMPSWMVRDQALAASGLLVSKVGGKPVKPYQPSGVWEEATFGNRSYKQDSGENLYRRSLYTFWRRIVAPTMFFDTASRTVCTVKQPRTNTPLQALATLNDITYVEAARALAQRALLKTELSPEEKLDYAFRLVLARKPAKEEKKVLMSAWKRLSGEYKAAPEAAAEFLSAGESKREESIPAIEHAAFAGVCLTILNLDEAITKE